MKRTLIPVAASTLLAVLAVIFLVGRAVPPDDALKRAFLPADFSVRINDVDLVEVVAAGNRVIATMQRADGEWRLEQMHGYRADWPRLKTLLADLAQATVVETKTDNPDYYSRLGVEDIAGEDAAGVLVSLTVGGSTTGVIIGNEPPARLGQYARIVDETVSVQLDREIGVAMDVMAWVDDGIVDIDAAEVAEVEIIHPDAGRVLATKVSADQADFDLADIPEGRELTSTWAVNSLASVLSLLDLEAVYPADDSDWTEAVRLRVLTFSGLEVIAETLEREGEYLLRLEAGQPAAAVAARAEVDEAASEVEAQAAKDVAQAVDEINRRVNGWVYAIAAYKYEAMVKTPEDLLKPLEEQ